MARDLLLLVCVPYVAVAVAYLEARRRRESPPTWARRGGAVAVLLHLAGLVALSSATGRSPFQSSAQALSFLGFSLSFLYVILESTSGITRYGGTFHLLTAILTIASVPALAAGGTPPPPGAPDPVRSFHTGLALLGTAAILGAGLLSAGYLNVYRRVKSHEISSDAGDAPTLFGLQRLARDASFLGSALLGPALVLGAISANRAGGPSPWALVGVTAVQFGLAFSAALLWWRRPMRGALAAWLGLAATGVAVVAFGVIHPILVPAGGGT